VKTESGETAWVNKPDHKSCAGCHSIEVKRFELGKHGMRLAQGLRPMTPEQARLPMKDGAAHKQLECNSCHGAHEYNLKQAAVESCLSCHDDKHSLAYKSSQHYLLWQKEVEGKAEANTGVSCASCHMPRINYDVSEWLSRVIVDHNQSANLSPNSKMIRSSCQDCHGLAFSIDATADRALISSNFKGQPSSNVKSMEMAEQEHLRHAEEIRLKIGENSGKNNSDTGMFGF
jgi:formate-dependent nitrite reductase cytochrome c552 subunit